MEFLSKLSDVLSDTAFNMLVVLALTLLFVLLLGLIVWGLGMLPLWWVFVQGYALLLAINLGLMLLTMGLYRVFRLDPFSIPMVLTNALLVALLSVGWSVYLTRGIEAFGPSNASTTFLVYGLGLLGSWIASLQIGAFFSGTLYQLWGLALTLSSYLIIALLGWFS